MGSDLRPWLHLPAYFGTDPADIELVEIHDINQAYERLAKSDVKYRFVIDLAFRDAMGARVNHSLRIFYELV